MRPVVLFACVVTAALVLFGGHAHAGRGLAVVNYGDEIFDLGPVDAAHPDKRIGKLCQHAGLFWADIATWSCRLVVTNQDFTRYGEIPSEMRPIVEAVFAKTEPRRSWWNQYGAYLFLALFALGLLAKLRGGRASAQSPAAGAFQPSQPARSSGRRTSFGRRGA